MLHFLFRNYETGILHFVYYMFHIHIHIPRISKIKFLLLAFFSFFVFLFCCCSLPSDFCEVFFCVIFVFLFCLNCCLLPSPYKCSCQSETAITTAAARTKYQTIKPLLKVMSLMLQEFLAKPKQNFLKVLNETIVCNINF